MVRFSKEAGGLVTMKTLGISYSRNKVKIHAKLKTNFTSFHFMLG